MAVFRWMFVDNGYKVSTLIWLKCKRMEMEKIAGIHTLLDIFIYLSLVRHNLCSVYNTTVSLFQWKHFTKISW